MQNYPVISYFQDDWECSLCELLVNVIDSYLKKNASAKEVNDTVYRVCDTLPSKLMKDLVSICTSPTRVEYAGNMHWPFNENGKSIRVTDNVMNCPITPLPIYQSTQLIYLFTP